MRKAFLRTILLSLLLLASNGSFADFKYLDRGSNSWGKFAYGMAFVARGYTPGHAFVVWFKFDRNRAKFVEYEGYGLYPDNRKKAVFGTVPGNILKEFNIYPNNGLIIWVTKLMYKKSQNITQTMKSRNVPYHFIKESCVDFVKSTASAIGLRTPSTSGLKNLPQRFISKLKEMNN
ncbi:MAG: hypothetical protein DRR19_27090 [Candidatus Parabeggiatoa sp. nov. 1]|nr:MAG: hypothetical protein DRR19_27090 [Gammaproteobacteria bacterium]